jgi:hypothetical protein
MGKMKEIAMIIQDGEVETLELMIRMAKKHKRSGVFFRGRNLTFEEADNMINFIYNEQNQIRRRQQSLEQHTDSNPD